MWYKELKQLRLAVGMPAKELAKKVGKSATYISRIESGAILNTSFELVSALAKVIAETESIKSGKVDLSNYNSDFSRMVLSYRYDDMKRVYNYAKENRYVEQYSNIVKYLGKSDIELFEIVARYRKSEADFNIAKEKLERAILKERGMDTLDEVVNSLRKEDCEIVLDVKIPLQLVIEGNYSDYMSLLSEEMEWRTEGLKNYGIEAIIDIKDFGYGIASNEEDSEIQLSEPRDM